MLDNVVLLLVCSVILVDGIGTMFVLVNKVVTMLVLLVSDDILSLLLVKAMADE